jgi:hypothetical protein
MELILGTFATFKKATVSSVVSIHMEQLGSRCTDFHEIRYVIIIRNSVEEVQVD